MNIETKVAALEKQIGDCAKVKPKKPVSPKTFIESPKYMNAKGTLYPEVLKAFVELNSGKYSEAILTGSIGCGKTTLALYTTAYQVYLVSCTASPQMEFELDPASEIVFIFQSVNAALAKNVDFFRFQEMIASAPYFKKTFRPLSSAEGEIRFPNRIVIQSLTGSPTSALGQNVFGGIVDEVNFMANQDISKLASDGGKYDQAAEIYKSITQRRKSRFMRGGRLAGMFCFVSSKRFAGEFTERKIAEALAQSSNTGNPIFVYDKRAWDIKPKNTFCGKWFHIFAGDMSRSPRILPETEPHTMSGADHLVIPIPIEFLDDFARDIHSALRDIAGISTSSIHPFILNKEPVEAAFGATRSILSRDSCDFVETKTELYEKRIMCLDQRRWVHIDLALSGDSAGIACGYVDRFQVTKRGNSEVEMMPRIIFDFILEIPPPKNAEINFERIRTLLYDLRDYDLPIRWVSMDSYQSKDMEQLLRHQGFVTGQQSMDKTTHPYDVMKTALQDGRIMLPDHRKAMAEIAGLERNPLNGKIDHPPGGSKDLADAIAGVTYGLSTRREIWNKHGVPIRNAPASLYRSNSANLDIQEL
jgi:hypothetical protein